jgi:hypothetical protein
VAAVKSGLTDRFVVTRHYYESARGRASSPDVDVHGLEVCCVDNSERHEVCDFLVGVASTEWKCLARVGHSGLRVLIGLPTIDLQLRRHSACSYAGGIIGMHVYSLVYGMSVSGSLVGVLCCVTV